MIRKFRTGERGQAIVEFAFVLPLVLLLIVAVADFGIAYQRSVQMANAVREGARYGSVFPLRVDASGNPDPENMKYRVKREASGFPLGDGDIQVFYEQANVSPPTSYAAGGVGASSYAVTGNAVRIQATTRYTPLTPFAALLFPSGSVTLSGTAVMRIE